MKTIFLQFFLPVVLLLIGFTSCEPTPIDDIEPDYVFDQSVLNGSWLSEGYDLAGIFQGSVQSLTLEIVDSTYTLVQEDASGSTIYYSGVLTIEAPTDSIQEVFPITFYQYSPDTLINLGIASVTDDVDAKELIIDIVPMDSLNYEIPNIEDGFGSGYFGLDGIQKYRGE